MRFKLLSIFLVFALPLAGCSLQNTSDKMNDAAKSVQDASEALKTTLDKADKVVSELEKQVGGSIPAETSEAAANGFDKTASVARGVQTGAAIVKNTVPPAAPFAGAVEIIAMAVAGVAGGMAEFFRRRKAAADAAKALAEKEKAEAEEAHADTMLALSAVTRSVETLPESTQDTVKEAVGKTAEMMGAVDIVKSEVSAAKG